MFLLVPAHPGSPGQRAVKTIVVVVVVVVVTRTVPKTWLAPFGVLTVWPNRNSIFAKKHSMAASTIMKSAVGQMPCSIERISC